MPSTTATWVVNSLADMKAYLYNAPEKQYFTHSTFHTAVSKFVINLKLAPSISKQNHSRDLSWCPFPSTYPMRLQLFFSIYECIIWHLVHAPVLLNVVAHLQVTGIGHEEGVRCWGGLLHSAQLKAMYDNVYLFWCADTDPPFYFLISIAYADTQPTLK